METIVILTSVKVIKLYKEYEEHDWCMVVTDREPHAHSKTKVKYYKTLKEAFKYIDQKYNEGIERLC